MTFTVEKTYKAMYVNIYNAVQNNTCKKGIYPYTEWFCTSQKKFNNLRNFPVIGYTKTTKIWLGNRSEVLKSGRLLPSLLLVHGTAPTGTIIRQPSQTESS